MTCDVESVYVVATHGDTADLQRHFLGSKGSLRVDRYKRYQQCVLPNALGLNIERLVVKNKLSTDWLLQSDLGEVIKKIVDQEAFPDYAMPKKTTGKKRRRFTRLTNAFSKKLQNLEHAVALHYMHYNFCRIHQTLRVTPAMEAGIANHVW